MTPSQTAHPTEGELLPCPLCWSPLEKSEEFSNRSRTVYAHAAQPDEAYPCPLSTFRLADDDTARVAAWNTRPDVRPQGEEGLVGKWRGQADGSRGLMLGAGRSDGLRHNAIADTLDACADDLARLSNQGEPSS